LNSEKQRLKAHFIEGVSARLKACPDTNHNCITDGQIALGGFQPLLDTQRVNLEPLLILGRNEMTYLEVVYRYQTRPGEAALRAIDSVREVYGIQRIQFNEKERTVRVRFDASRLKGDAVAKLLRQAGIDVQDQLVLA
jgi:hypothetical protein